MLVGQSGRSRIVFYLRAHVSSYVSATLDKNTYVHITRTCNTQIISMCVRARTIRIFIRMIKRTSAERARTVCARATRRLILKLAPRRLRLVEVWVASWTGKNRTVLYACIYTRVYVRVLRGGLCLELETRGSFFLLLLLFRAHTRGITGHHVVHTNSCSAVQVLSSRSGLQVRLRV